MLTSETLRTIKATILSDTTSSKEIESACNLLLSEANPTFSISFFENTIKPILRHLLSPSHCPATGDSSATWSDRIPTFSCLCRFISRGPQRTVTFKGTIDAILPSFITWATCILGLDPKECDIDTLIDLFDALNAISTHIQSPALFGKYPLFGATLVAAYFPRITDHTDRVFVDEKPFISWTGLCGEVYGYTIIYPGLKHHLAAVAPKIASSSIVALSTVLTTTPTSFPVIGHILDRMESIVTLDVHCHALFENRIIYWCIQTVQSVIRTHQRGDLVPHGVLIKTTHSCLRILHECTNTLGQRAIKQAASLSLFSTLARLEHLAFQHEELATSISSMLIVFTPFLIYPSILRPAARSLRLITPQWLGEENSFFHFVRETYRARCEYESRGGRICWSLECMYYDYSLPRHDKSPQCAECSQRRHVMYCNVECQTRSWPAHRKTCKMARFLVNNEFVQDDDANLTVNLIPLQAKEMEFLFFLATKALEANIDRIFSHFIAADLIAYTNVNACIRFSPVLPTDVVFEPATSIGLSAPSGLGDIPVHVQVPVLSSGKSTIYAGVLQLPFLMGLRESTANRKISPVLVRARSKVMENPMGGWRLEI